MPSKLIRYSPSGKGSYKLLLNRTNESLGVITKQSHFRFTPLRKFETLKIIEARTMSELITQMTKEVEDNIEEIQPSEVPLSPEDIKNIFNVDEKLKQRFEDEQKKHHPDMPGRDILWFKLRRFHEHHRYNPESKYWLVNHSAMGLYEPFKVKGRLQKPIMPEDLV